MHNMFISFHYTINEREGFGNKVIKYPYVILDKGDIEDITFDIRRKYGYESVTILNYQFM